MHSLRLACSCALVALVALCGSLRADSFTFTDQGVGFSISGTLIADPNGDGTFTALSGTGVFSGGLYNGDTITLYANPNAPNAATSPLDAFNYDDQLLPNGNLLDDYGLLFTLPGVEVNIWYQTGGDCGGSGPFCTYTAIGQGNFGIADNQSIFTLTQTPEPSSVGALLLDLACGLLVLGFLRKSRPSGSVA